MTNNKTTIHIDGGTGAITVEGHPLSHTDGLRIGTSLIAGALADQNRTDPEGAQHNLENVPKVITRIMQDVTQEIQES